MGKFYLHELLEYVSLVLVSTLNCIDNLYMRIVCLHAQPLHVGLSISSMVFYIHKVNTAIFLHHDAPLYVFSDLLFLPPCNHIGYIEMFSHYALLQYGLKHGVSILLYSRTMGKEIFHPQVSWNIIFLTSSNFNIICIVYLPGPLNH